MNTQEENILINMTKALNRMAAALEEWNEINSDDMVAEIEFVPEFEVDLDS